MTPEISGAEETEPHHHYFRNRADAGQKPAWTCECGQTRVIGVRNPALPVAPLLAAIRRRGGLGPVMRRRLMREGRLRFGEGADTTPEYAAADRTLYRATAEGEGLLSRQWVDEFCCKTLQLHPCAVYGDDWFDFSEEFLARGSEPDRDKHRRPETRMKRVA